MPTLADQLAKIITKRALGLWPELKGKLPLVRIERSAERKHGDYATSLPLQLAGVLKRPPLEIAEALKNAGVILPALDEPTIASPGFLNFALKKSWLEKQPKRILAAGERYGKSDIGKKKRVHLEFISANPTGPLTLGNGRGGFTGDVLGNVLEASGYRVERVYYVNDIGKQIETLAESIIRRYFQLQGIQVEYPNECYQGAYITELAKTMKLDGVSLTNIDRAKAKIKGRAVVAMLREIKRVIAKKLKIHFDRFFFESELYTKGLPKRLLNILNERGLTEERDSAVWMKTTAYGDDKDRVLVKADGDQTYFLSDVAYVWYKFAVRRYDEAILLLGADHHGYVRRLKAVSEALGFPGRFDVRIFQLVRLIENGQEVRMSKRSGTFVTLEELVDEVGPDVARFFFLMVGAGTHMDFDLSLAKERSEKNPVYYVQYANARICSILRNARPLLKRGKLIRHPKLENESVFTLTKTLLQFPELVEASARTRTVSDLPAYAIRLATAFHDFYTRVRIISNGSVHQQALELTEATQLVLRQSLKLLGVRAPERM